MENQSPFEKSNNYYKRRIATLLIFGVFLIFLGRHMTFLPTINLSGKDSNEKIVAVLGDSTKDKTGFYSIYYKDLKTGGAFGIDEKQIQTATSVNKIPIIASLYYLANEAPNLSLDEKVTITDTDVQDYGTGSIRYQKMPQVYSLRNLAKLALKDSDNTAAHVLSVRIGQDVIQRLVDDWGLAQTDMVNNQTTAYDMGKLFEMIYKGKITNEANTNELLEFMTDTDFEDRLSKNLPENVKVYHKTGDGEGSIHDVGIIDTGNNVYFLGVMTSDVGEAEQETKDTIAEISEKIYKLVIN